MDFFRLRLINTLLVLLIGIVLGYIMKERIDIKEAVPYTAKYPAATAMPPAGPDEPASPDTAPDQEDVVTEIGPAAEPAQRPTEPGHATPGSRETATPAARADEPAYRESAPAPEDKKKEKNKTDDVTRGAEDAFFKDPGRFAGRELEMDLQMIMARKTPKGWLINLVRSKGGKNADYLYMDDDSVLGENPDLRIGYFYTTRFACVKGDTASGNKLISLTPTNNKASWATGVSAVE